MMITRISRISFVFAAFASASVVAPLTPSFALTSVASSNEPIIQQAMVPVAFSSTGIYDGNDQYRDGRGFPRSGWDYLSLPPS